MKIFIAGAEDFCGSHLTEHLINSGFKVTALIQYIAISVVGFVLLILL